LDRTGFTSAGLACSTNDAPRQPKAFRLHQLNHSNENGKLCLQSACSAAL